MGIRLWLDDVRPAPEGWTWAKSAREAIEILDRETVQECSLDFDLWHVHFGEGPLATVEWQAGCPKGIAVVEHMRRSGRWPKTKPRVHSANPDGAAEMRAAIDKYGPY